MRKRAVFLGMFLLFSSLSFGQGINDVLSIEDSPEQEEARLSLGVGGAMVRQPYKGMETEFYVIPIIDYQKGNFSFHGNRAAYLLYRDCKWKFSLIGEMRQGVYEDSDDEYLKGMQDRDMTLDGGFAIGTDLGGIGFTASWLTDLFSKHQGQEVRLVLDKRFTCDRLTLTPSAGLSFYDNNFADYYYGVRTREARPNRPAFDVDSAYSLFAGVWADYRLDCNWSIFSGFTYTWYSGEITDSPVVERDYMTSVIAGLKYQF